jgi:hypothetical protein
MHYVAKIATGAEVDSSRSKGRPFSFVIGCGAVIPGWDEVRRREEKRRRREEKGGEGRRRGGEEEEKGGEEEERRKYVCCVG